LDERQNLDQLRKDHDETKAKHVAVSEESKSLQLQLETERRHSEHLNKTLSEAETKDAFPSEEMKNLESQLAAEHWNAERLGRELSTTKAERSMLMSRLSTEQQESEKLRKSSGTSRQN
jgi:hypothetical protein